MLFERREGERREERREEKRLKLVNIVFI